MSDKVVTDIERNNKTVMKTHCINVVVMCLFCVLQVVDGREKPAYALIVLLLGLVPIALEYVFWKKDKETTMIKHIAAYGFAIFYTYTLFTATNNMVFLFAIPMILAVSIYNDKKYSLKINAGVIIESIIIVILGAKTGEFGYAGMDSAIIQIVICILVAVYSFMVADTSNKNNKHQVQSVITAQQQTEKLFQDISELSAKMQQGIESVYQDLHQLRDSSQFTKNIMSEVSVGIDDTAQTAQNQLLQTESIQNKVDFVNRATEQIGVSMKHTFKVLEDGQKDIDLLVHQVEESVKDGAEVAEKLKTLDSYMTEMNSIVELINNITTQTELLSLNASIEAARAGEAGKGFAVVASEISSMATQTSGATEDITELIGNVSAAINEVVSVIYQMIEGINDEKISTTNTAESFHAIQRNTFTIRDNVDNLMDSVIKLQEANSVIMDSVQTISAISEEVAAHAGRTMQAEETNEQILEKISQKMQETIDLIQNKN